MTSGMTSSRPHLSCPGELFNLPVDTVVVADADEEIMELYMSLASSKGESSGDGGLGFLDASKPELELSLELTPPDAIPTSVAENGGVRLSRRSRVKDKTKQQPVSLELAVVQDLAALRNRVGDTGSVLWRSSLHLARHLLTQHYFPPSAPAAALLDPVTLSSAHVLELGAGTGVLAALLAPLCAKYTATDQADNLKLIRRNVELNAGVTAGVSASTSASGDSGGGASGRAVRSRVVADVCELDWTSVSALRERGRPGGGYDGDEVDLVLAVDCIYNEHLVKPLVDTLRAVSVPGRTVVWVVVELRSADVLSIFIDTWLRDEGWTIVRLGHLAMGHWPGGRGRWVGWVGWR